MNPYIAGHTKARQTPGQHTKHSKNNIPSSGSIWCPWGCVGETSHVVPSGGLSAQRPLRWFSPWSSQDLTFTTYFWHNPPSVLSDYNNWLRIQLYTFLDFWHSFTTQWHLTGFCQSARKRGWSAKLKWFQTANHMLEGGAYHTLRSWGFHGNTFQNVASWDRDKGLFLPASPRWQQSLCKGRWSEKEELVLTDGQKWLRYLESAQSQLVDLFGLLSEYH